MITTLPKQGLKHGIFYKLHLRFLICLSILLDAYESQEYHFEAESTFQFNILENSINTLLKADYLKGTFAKQYHGLESQNYGNVQFSVAPSYQYIQDDLAVLFGFKTYFLMDSERNKNDFYIYPNIEVSYRLNNNGFRAYGIDSSEAMVQYSTSKYPDSEFKCGDVKKSLEFEPETFSHVLCTYFTLYEMGDKSVFFDNCRRWLKTGGYLIVHLVDKLEFDTIVPVGKLFKNRHIDENTNTNNGTRILSTSVALPNIQYSHKYAFHDHDVVNRIETFTDKKTHKVRHQEGRTTITPISDIIQMAKSKGFYVKGYADYFPYNRDKHQYLYFFEKIDV